MGKEYLERKYACKDCIHFAICCEDWALDSEGKTTAEQYKVIMASKVTCRHFKSADVVEVRHGKWYKGDMPTYGGYKCSFCELNTVEYNKPYCPNCGAKMDGKGEGDGL